MTLSLGIRLVIIFPTLLFLIGFVFKCIIEKKNLRKLLKKENKIGLIDLEQVYDFIFILAIESIFLFIANGLILIFELQQVEIGIIIIIVGVVLSICLLVGSYTKHFYAAVTGFLGVFGLLSGQLAYFSSYGIEIMIGQFPLWEVLSIIGFIVGIVFGKWMDQLLDPGIENQIKTEN